MRGLIICLHAKRLAVSVGDPCSDHGMSIAFELIRAQWRAVCYPSTKASPLVHSQLLVGVSGEDAFFLAEISDGSRCLMR